MIKYQKPDPKNRSADVLRAEKKSRKPDKRIMNAKSKPQKHDKGKR